MELHVYWTATNIFQAEWASRKVQLQSLAASVGESTEYFLMLIFITGKIILLLLSFTFRRYLSLYYLVLVLVAESEPNRTKLLKYNHKVWFWFYQNLSLGADSRNSIKSDIININPTTISRVDISLPTKIRLTYNCHTFLETSDKTYPSNHI